MEETPAESSSYSVFCFLIGNTEIEYYVRDAPIHKLATAWAFVFKQRHESGAEYEDYVPSVRLSRVKTFYEKLKESRGNRVWHVDVIDRRDVF